MFVISSLPYILNVFNVMSYPVELDGEHVATEASQSFLAQAGGTLRILKREFVRSDVWSMMMESALFSGVFKSGKDFMQVLVQLEIAKRMTDAEKQPQLTAVILGIVYWFSFLVAAISAREAHRVVNSFPSEEQAARYVWSLNAAVYAILALALIADLAVLAVICFVALHGMQNVWKPLIVSRISSCTDQTIAATMLSTQAQLASLGKFVSGPLVGYAIDRTMNASVSGTASFLPFPCLGFAATLGICCCYRSKPEMLSSEPLLGSSDAD